MARRSVRDESKQFISDEEELERIRKKKLKELARLKETKLEMSKEPFHLTDLNFDEVVGKNSLVLVDFWAAWCGPCRALAPTIDELAKEYAGKVLVGKLNVDENPNTAERFQVFSIPTVLIMKDGREVDRVVGCVPKEYIETALKKHVR
ncbi:MAG: thioredoxin [Candidatus Bathyarchaeia archaeon]